MGTVGGGTKKVLYTLNTIRQMGVGKAGKALVGRNTCKACALGMGGQKGGMVNELGEYPAVCNKSVQAQSSDTQPPIPEAVLGHSLKELRELSGHELEHLGRLNTPLHKEAGADRYRPVDWDYALNRMAERFAATDPARTFFYSSGRSSNEAGFVLQLMARLYGTNSVNNCSYYCHQATSAALGGTVGTGTATIELEDLTGCDLIFVIGANPSSNHPRFIHKLKDCRDRGGDVIMINPAREPGLVRFAVPKSAKSMLSGGTWIASDYLQPRIGTDIALFKGIAKAVLENGWEDEAFITAYSNGFAAFRDDVDATGWDEIVARCGVSRESITRVAERYARAENVVFAWGMGMTHHLHGVSNIEYIANLALLRGMVGKRYAGLLPLRGHSNVQGIGTIGVKPVLPEGVFQAMENHLGIELPRTPGYDTMGGMQAAHAGEVDAALMMGGNLYGSNPNAAWAGEALDRIPFKAFLTTTLNRGHVCGVDNGEVIILPVTARDEEWQPTSQESMFNYVRLSDGGIQRLDNVRPEVWVLTQLARRLLGENCPVDFEAFANHSTIRTAIARTVPGMEQLESLDKAREEFHISGRLLHSPQFRTADGRASFRVHELPPWAAPEAGYYTLTTVRSEGQFNTIVYEETDTYRGTESRWTVMMNPEDIAAAGLADGGTADLASANGRMRGVTVKAFDLPRGSIMAYFPEANAVTATDVDARSKTPSFKSTVVWLERVSAEHEEPVEVAEPAVS
ncbi:FdhF/YdeP family oxidoreductase [Ectothiorhodospiraceae bacterium WFHF3C12]|nr:FdhF/YdeP family oxidoreductase [Ectothiorhodospiraceae bacterium WFHF3C12]